MSITCCINSGDAMSEKKVEELKTSVKGEEDLQQNYQETGLPLFDISD
jgi:hypothetical protein